MKKKLMTFGREFALEGITLAVIVLLFWIFMKKGILNDRDLIQPILWNLMILIGIGVLILAFCKRLTYKGLVSVILISLLIRPTMIWVRLPEWDIMDMLPMS